MILDLKNTRQNLIYTVFPVFGYNKSRLVMFVHFVDIAFLNAASGAKLEKQE